MLKLTDISEVRSAFIIRAIALMMDAVHSSETSSQIQRDYMALHPRRL
jgi:hypothetical protein